MTSLATKLVDRVLNGEDPMMVIDGLDETKAITGDRVWAKLNGKSVLIKITKDPTQKGSKWVGQGYIEKSTSTTVPKGDKVDIIGHNKGGQVMWTAKVI